MNELYRLSFDTIDANMIDYCAFQYGEECWPLIDFKNLRWHTVRKETTSPFTQYDQLKRWAQSHEQPIRNVILERLVTQPVWERVENER